MSAPILVNAPWASGGKYDSYRLSSKGKFTGQIHPPCFAFMANPNPNAEVDKELTFMACRNIGSGFGSICASLPKSFTSLPPKKEFSCDLILHRGVYYCPTTKKLFHLYYVWKNNIGSYDDITSCMKTNTLSSFIKDRFNNTLCITSVKKMNLRCLNQMSGYTFPQWKISLSFALRDGLKYHENSLKPDVWFTKELFREEERKHPRMKVAPKSYVDGVTFSNNNNNTAKNCGLAKLRQFDGTLSIYCLRRVRLGKFDGRGLVWVPLVTASQHRQEFALIKPAQKEKFDADLLKRKPSDRYMRPEVFRKHMEQMVEESGTGSIRNCLGLKCGFEWKQKTFQNIIVSFVQPSESLNQDKKMNEFDKVVEGDTIHWLCVLPKNVSDVDHPVECFPIFRGYPWPYERILDEAHNTLLTSTYHGRGQIRSQLGYSQRGNGRMVGIRQSNQASSNMGEVSGTINHHYWVESTTNTSLVQQTAAISNALTEQAIDVQNNSGQIIIGLLKLVIMKIEHWNAKSFDICPHTILTMPYINAKTGILETYSSGDHEDCDTTNDQYGELMNKYVEEEGCQKLKKYVSQMRAICTDLGKKRFPLPTTCCSSLNDPKNLCSRFIHKKYFVVASAGISWDISSDIMLNGNRQLGSTFHGNVASHLTSASIWISKNGMVTTINPGISDPAWGTSGGYAYMSRHGQVQRQMVVNVITNYMDQNNGAMPRRLPGINMAAFTQNNLAALHAANVGV